MDGHTGTSGEGKELSIMVDSFLSSICNVSQWSFFCDSTVDTTACCPWFPQIALRVNLRLDRSLRLCGDNETDPDCCTKPLCVLETLQLSACVNDTPQASVMIQARIHTQLHPVSGSGRSYSSKGFTHCCPSYNAAVFLPSYLFISIFSNCRGQHNSSKPVLPNAWAMSLWPHVWLMWCSLLLW